MSLHNPRITKILSYTVCDQVYRRSFCLVRFSSSQSGIINDTFWNPFENYEETGGSHAEMEEKLKKIFYDLYSRADVRDLWVSDFNAVLKYKNLNFQPYAFFEKRSVTGTVISIIHKSNKYPANTWILGMGAQKVWVKMPWNIKGGQPGEMVHIRAEGGHIRLIPAESPVKVSVDETENPAQFGVS